MHGRNWTLLGAALLLASACTKKPADEPTPAEGSTSTSAHAHSMHGVAAPNFAPGETRDFGQAPAEDAAALSVSALLETCAEGQTCVVDAQIGASCTSSGCWSTLSAEGLDEIVFVEMRDEGFTFPKNAAGATGQLVGQLERASFSVAEANYYRSQTARVRGEEAPARVDQEVQGWLFTIDGARLTAPE